MGCLKLSYYEQERALEVNPIFHLQVVEKNGIAEKNRVSSSTYGFNGKEKDANLGEGTHYDYGFRIYKPRIAKFLSVDPLFKSYPMLTPYQFASNRPIDGIDLDGLEYLDYREARIEVKYGRVQIKVQNFNHIFKTNWWIANMNSKNWRRGEIGLNSTVANLVIGGSKNSIVMDNSPERNLSYPAALGVIKKPGLNRKNSSPLTDFTEIRVVSEGNPYNQGGSPTISSIGNKKVTSGARKVGIGAAIGLGLEMYAIYGFAMDKTAMDNQLENDLQNALIDLKGAVRNGLIDSEYMNSRDLGNILNVILQGKSNSSNPDILNIGIKILKETGNYRGGLEMGEFDFDNYRRNKSDATKVSSPNSRDID